MGFEAFGCRGVFVTKEDVLAEQSEIVGADAGNVEVLIDFY